MTAINTQVNREACLVPDEAAHLSKARRLGYLKVDRLDNPLTDPYLEWAWKEREPAILLYRCRRRSSAIVYRMPYPDYALTDRATEHIRQLARHYRDAFGHGSTIITPVGGEIPGLDSSRAEELAFWIADAALDAQQTEPR